ncbi:uncharacterized protein LOC114255366 [Monomorium pharaonis]|uniref:uncharacterized protein LOC114255366 n=1 Tax=Monomorium pharaonis TaxID=307658 RepID=UPI0017474F41|nr:uncharacterized protein LOC114255366 [Monomorium pharaonis]
MKCYVCAILLLMCGLVHFALQSSIQVSGHCQFGSQIFPVGRHSVFPCMEIICHMDGQVSLFKCPTLKCEVPAVNRVVGYTDMNLNLIFPECCPKPVCQLDQELYKQIAEDQFHKLQK